MVPCFELREKARKVLENGYLSRVDSQIVDGDRIVSDLRALWDTEGIIGIDT